MQWDWEAVKSVLWIFGLPITVGFLLVWSAAKLIGRVGPMKPKEEEPRKKTFLEEALDADFERPKPARAYTWDEFQTDLHDAALDFNSIYEKYGGVFPKKPQTSQESPGDLQEPQASPGLQGADGGPGGAAGAAGVPGADARMAQLQEWFKDRGKDVPLQGLVPPPPAPHTVIHKIYTRGRR